MRDNLGPAWLPGQCPHALADSDAFFPTLKSIISRYDLYNSQSGAGRTPAARHER